MSTDERLVELLERASAAIGDDLRTDPRALISRARRHRRRHRTIGGLAMALVALLGTALVPAVLRDDADIDVAVGDRFEEPPPVWADPPPAGWTRLPDPPLSPRTGARVVSVGNEVVVVGGFTMLCDGPAGCSPDEDSFRADGAAFDLTTRSWRPMAAAPASFRSATAIAIDGAVYLLPHCMGPSFAAAACDALLRYRPSEDAWDVLPRPEMGLNNSMVRLGRDLIVSGDDNNHAPSIWRFEIASGTWTRLPADPLPQGDGRALGTDGDDLLLFVMEFGRAPGTSSRMMASRWNVATGQWRTLPPAPGGGFEERVLDGVAIQGSSSRPTGPGASLPDGGIFDPRSDSWRPFPTTGWRTPSPLRTAADWRSGVVGVLRGTAAVFEAAGGLALDVEANAWIEVPAVDDRTMSSVTAVGRRLFQFGGSRPGRLLNDAWVWTPPAEPDQAAPSTPKPSPVPTSAPPTLPVPTTAAAPTSSPPSAPLLPTPTATPTTGAPQWVSARGDAAAGKVAVQFDRPVVPVPNDGPPGAQISRTVMTLLVFGTDSTCSSAPVGQGVEVLEGTGTDTLTTSATGLVAGTSYIVISNGFARSAADGTPNAIVDTKGGVTSPMFGGTRCIPIPVSG